MGILDKISDFANKAADKLIPKELAPVLPFASLLLGPTLGIGSLANNAFARFLIPQTLTALSSAKQTGEIDPKLQALTGIQSLLQGPQTQTAAEAKLIQDNPELVERFKKASQLKDALPIDDATLRKLAEEPGRQILGTDPGSGFFGETIGKFTEAINPYNPFGIDAEDVLQFGTGDDAKFFLKDSAALDDFLAQTIKDPVPGLDKLTGDKLVSELSRAKGFDADRITGMLDDIYEGPAFLDPRPLEPGQTARLFSGRPDAAIALNKARGFFDTPLGFNKPTFAKVGIGAAPFLGAQAANLKAEQEALEAEEAAETERFAGARDDLFDYFRRLSDPQGLFTAAEGGRAGFKKGGKSGFSLKGILNSLYGKGAIGINEIYNMSDPGFGLSLGSLLGLYNQGGQVNQGIMSAAPGMPQGMQVDGRNGTFIPMGVKEKADDVPAMLSKNEFVMTADAVRAAGGGSVEQGAQRMYDLMNSLEARA